MFSYPKKKCKIENIIRKVNKIGLDDIGENCYYNRAIDAIYKVINNITGKDEYNIVFTTIDYKKLFQTYNTKDGITINDDTLLVEYYNNYCEMSSQYLFYHLNQLFAEKKPVIMIADLLNYMCLSDGEDRLHNESHSAFYLFLPVDNDYEMLYFNSHGNYIEKEHTHYNLYVTRYRAKLIELSCGVDFYVNRSFVKAFNKNVREYKLNSSICYNTTKLYNYNGINLQQSDNYGLCYAFPLLLFKSVIITQKNKNLILPSLAKLLEYRQYNTFMLVALSYYSKKLIELLNNTFEDFDITSIDYDKHLMANEERFNTFMDRNTSYILKQVVQEYLHIIKQPDIKNKMTEYINAEEV